MGAPLVAVVFGLSIVPARAEYEIFTQRYSADPAPLAHAGRVWMYTTHDNLEPGYTMRDYNAFSSDDMVNWRDEGIVFSFDSISWTNAPSNAPTAPPSAAASLGSWPSGVAALLVRALAWAAGAPLNQIPT